MDWDRLEKLAMKIVALIGLNVLAVCFDGQWIYFAVGVDAVTLGFSLKGVSLPSGKTKEETSVLGEQES